jgi:class 3 adenylate cyclase
VSWLTIKRNVVTDDKGCVVLAALVLAESAAQRRLCTHHFAPLALPIPPVNFNCNRHFLHIIFVCAQDNEVRAISAAHEMLQALSALHLEGGIGITTGSVYCGFVGAEKRCEYAMMGACVNLSARLMAAAAPNTINVRARARRRRRLSVCP